MKTLTKGPRLSREVFVPASPTSRSRKSAMAIPKTNRAGAPYGVNPSSAIAGAITEVTPVEKRALQLIVATAHIIDAGGGKVFLMAPAEPELIDALATIGTELEDLEDGGDYEQTDPTPDTAFNRWFSARGYEPTDASDDEPDVDKEENGDDEPFVNQQP